MKKIMLALFAALLVPTASFAINIYADLNGAYTQAGDLENQLGFGGTVAVSIIENVNAFGRIIYGSCLKDANTPEETEYTYLMMLGGFQHLLRIKDSPVFWTASVALGLADGSMNPSHDRSDEDIGLCAAFWTGFIVDATQYVSAYIEAGYHYSNYDSAFANADIKGFQVLFGVRISVWGKNRSIFERY